MNVKKIVRFMMVMSLLFLVGCSSTPEAKVEKDKPVNKEKYEQLIQEQIDSYNGELTNVTLAEVYSVGYLENIDKSAVMVKVVGDLNDHDRYNFPDSEWYGLYVMDDEEWISRAALTVGEKAEEIIEGGELLYEKEY
ncbi:hypothetical protein ACYSNR_09150 [Enterococcus sp. LJL128]